MKARYKSRCARCATIINIGAPIRRDYTSRKFVHASCVKVLRRVSSVGVVGAAVVAGAAPVDGAAAAVQRLPPGLKPRSLEAYRAEFNTYVGWVTKFQSVVPGRDSPWDATLLWRYLQFRSERCKVSTLMSAISMLAYFSPETGHVLPNDKCDGNPQLRRALDRIKKQLKIDAAQEVADESFIKSVQRSTPLDKGAVELALATLQVTSEERFARLNRVDRHNVVLTAVQHTAGMRFGHFLARQYTDASFRKDADGSRHLISDWGRFPSVRRFCLDFLARPRYACQVYIVRNVDGSVAATLTAAMLLQWHFRLVHAEEDTLLFEPVKGEEPVRLDRQQWLRNVLLGALPLHEKEAREAIRRVTPHSFRSGLAGDLLRADVPLIKIAAICRWSVHNTKTIRMYAERSSFSATRTCRSFRLRRHAG